ncbi:MAG: methyltransferase family protein [Omnitrophica WOR_2 bacterium]
MKFIFRQLSSFAAPILFCIVIPYLIVVSRSGASLSSVFNPSPFFAILGLLVCLAGLAGFILTVRMLIQIGRGTIMPWDPARRLVTGSLYAYVRNPMILSVILIEAGEAILFASYWLGLLAVLFFVINTLYFTFSEEPGLEKRFGQEYVEYKEHVPRWIPRLTPWHPGE